MIDRLKELVDKLKEWAKDPAKLAFGLVIVFFLSILFSTYKLATLHSSLIYKGGMTTSGSEGWVFAGLFTSVGITFLLGLTAIYVNQKVKKEIVVFVEKKEEQTSSEGSKSSDENYFDLKNFQDSISKLSSTKEKQQQGLNLICKYVEAGQGAFYEWNGNEAVFSLGYAFAPELDIPPYKAGEGLVGQAATGRSIYLDELPEDYLNAIESGLGSAKPRSLFLVPVVKDGSVKGVIEVATLKLLGEGIRKNTLEAAKILADNC